MITYLKVTSYGSANAFLNQNHLFFQFKLNAGRAGRVTHCVTSGASSAAYFQLLSGLLSIFQTFKGLCSCCRPFSWAPHFFAHYWSLRNQARIFFRIVDFRRWTWGPRLPKVRKQLFVCIPLKPAACGKRRPTNVSLRKLFCQSDQIPKFGWSFHRFCK